MSLIYGNTDPATFNPANNVPIQVDANGIVQTNAGGSFSFHDFAANGTTTLKTGAGVLHTVTINAVGSGETIQLYDNTTNSGTLIATITPVAGMTYLFDAAFSTGLTVRIAGTTAGDYTVTWK